MSKAVKIWELDFEKTPEHWHLVRDFMKLRNEVFVKQLGWQLTSYNTLEFEQYDCFATVIPPQISGVQK